MLPKIHSASSVAQILINGLESGTVVLPWSTFDPEELESQVFRMLPNPNSDNLNLKTLHVVLQWLKKNPQPALEREISALNRN